jgi:hypothetical protein
MARRIHIKGVRRQELDIDTISYVLFLEGKRIARERRERDAIKKSERRERETRNKRQGDHHER